MLSSLRSYLRFRLEFDFFCPVSPDVVKLIKTKKKESQVAELPELIILIEAPTKLEKHKLIGLRNRAMLELLFSTGMRISELCNLNTDQLMFNNNDGKHIDSGKICILGKGKKQRFVYLTERCRIHPALFIPYKGSRAFVKHGFATYLAEASANSAAIQVLLGHESLATTTRYVHASDRFAENTHKQFHPLKTDNDDEKASEDFENLPVSNNQTVEENVAPSVFNKSK
ncbi:MAG: tyrosine-type recombinase/integrase [bacterium]